MFWFGAYLMFEVEKHYGSGLKVMRLHRFNDLRGNFLKIFNNVQLRAHCSDPIVESYITTSKKDVVRGMHFQSPPCDHTKLVVCLSGSVLDVVVDLQTEGVGYGQVTAIHLDSLEPKLLCIPKGFAHGFLSLSDDTTMLYMQTTVHSPEFDHGVLWSSINFEWPVRHPILSKRDTEHPPLTALTSPF